MFINDVVAGLPSIEVLRERCRALAVLERIVSDAYPYWSWDTRWGAGEAALINDGGGDELTVVFGADGVFVRVFDHESATSPFRDDGRIELWPGMLDGLPEVLRPYADDPALAGFGCLMATAAAWRLTGDDRWHTGQGFAVGAPDEPGEQVTDGSGMLAILCDDGPGEYLALVRDLHEIELDRSAVEHVLAGRPLTEDVVRALDPAVDLAAVRADVIAIGYPTLP